MKYGKLRVASSVLCGIACVFLIALWVASYWWVDILSVRVGSHARHIWCIDGSFYAFAPGNPGEVKSRLRIYDRSNTELGMGIVKNWLGFGAHSTQHGVNVVVPIWCLALLTFTIGMIAAPTWRPWQSPRFSLRTLLIATRVVAVGLGLIVWAVR